MKSYSEYLNVKDITIKFSVISLMCALAVVLSILDGFIPVMMFLPPGAKLGLSNVATMFTSVSVGVFPALIIAVIKSIFVGITRGVTAFFMSFFAGVISTFVSGVLLIKREQAFGFVGIGIIGATVHNIVQLIVAMIMTQTVSLLYFLPVLLLFAIITGSLTGMVLKVLMPALQKINI